MPNETTTPVAEGEIVSVKLEVNKAELITLAEDGSSLVLNADAEGALIQLLELQSLVDSTVSYVKDQIVEAGLALDPTFSTVSGDRVKANYQYSGAVYKMLEGRKEFPAPLFKREVKVSIDSKAMAAYEKEHRRLPKYVVRATRKQNLVVKVK